MTSSRWIRLALCTAAVGLVTALGACAQEAPPPNGRPFAGWVPTPPPTLEAYAACLRKSGVTVDRLVGMYVVTKSDPAVTSANGDCSSERKAHQQTITGVDHKIPDEDGYRFVTQVRSCLSGKATALPAEDEPVFVLGDDPQRVLAFDDCVEEIRARPTPSEF